MPRTLAEWAAGALLNWRLNSRIRTRRGATPPSTSSKATERTNPQMLSFLDGYKTYLIAAAMCSLGSAN